MKKLLNFDAEQLFWLKEFGWPKKRISLDKLKSDLSVLDAPVFFLSTGRCGTKWFANLFSNIKGLKSFHSASSDLASQNCYAYKIQKEQKLNDREINELLGHIFLAGREQYLRYSYKTDKRYLETNNHLTFFAFAIADLIPSSKFVHVYRHPGDFVSSGLKRLWYEDEITFQRQIQPINKDTMKWNDLSTIEKISWLWVETNEFIEDFKKYIPSNRIMSFDFSKKNAADLSDLFDFIGVNISKSKMLSNIYKKMNDQEYIHSEKYNNWKQEDKDKLIRYCVNLAKKYGYKL